MRTDAITLVEAASILGRSEATVRRLINQGRLPAVRLRSGKRGPLVVRRRDVLRLRAWFDVEKELRLQNPESQRVRRQAEELLAKSRVSCVTCGQKTLKRMDSDKYATCSAECRRISRMLTNYLHGRALGVHMRRGSAAERAAKEAMQRRLPIFDRLPESIRKQLRGEIPRLTSYPRQGQVTR